MSKIPWIEKYRPKIIKDLVIESSTMFDIKNIIKNKDMPNLIITGPPGVGKTTTVLCLAQALYGIYYKDNVLEINASDDRGIKSVQNIITNFCSTQLSYNKNDDIKNFAKHKLIILDEADNITDKAQHLINILMDKYYETTRFAFTCNTSSYILESIQSRCKILRYGRSNINAITIRLKQILIKENIKYDIKALDNLAYLSYGDIRQAINLTQMTYDRFKDKITQEHVDAVCELPKPVIIKDILLQCLKKDFKTSMIKIHDLKISGFSTLDILLSILYTLKLPLSNDILENQKIFIYDIVCHYLFIISKNIDTDLQLSSCIVDMCK